MDKKIIENLNHYPRDMTGYGSNSIHPNWPNKAKVALQFVLNYEEAARTVYCTVTRLRRHSYQKSSLQSPMMVIDI